MELKSAKVIMLPSEERTQILYNTYLSRKYGNPLVFDNQTIDNPFNRGYQAQHLYFVIKDEIKEGDWCVYLKQNKSDPLDKTFVFQAGNESESIDEGWPTINTSSNTFVYKHECKKIIGSTEFLLLPAKSEYDSVVPRVSLPTQAFIKKYCKLGGVDDVMVEYTRDYSNRTCETCSLNDFCDTELKLRNKCCTNTQDEKDGDYWSSQLDDESDSEILHLKVDSHNTITTHPVKDSWTRKEVEFLLFTFMNRDTFQLPNGALAQEPLDDWMKENL